MKIYKNDEWTKLLKFGGKTFWVTFSVLTLFFYPAFMTYPGFSFFQSLEKDPLTITMKWWAGTILFSSTYGLISYGILFFLLISVRIFQAIERKIQSPKTPTE